MVYIVMLDRWAGDIMRGGYGGRPILVTEDEVKASSLASLYNFDHGDDEPACWVVELEMDKENK